MSCLQRSQSSRLKKETSISHWRPPSPSLKLLDHVRERGRYDSPHHWRPVPHGVVSALRTNLLPNEYSYTPPQKLSSTISYFTLLQFRRHPVGGDVNDALIDISCAYNMMITHKSIQDVSKKNYKQINTIENIAWIWVILKFWNKN